MVNDNNIGLFQDKKKCCGCGACKSICPKHLIELRKDEFGFYYPIISNRDNCIKCGMCQKVCAFQNTITLNSPCEVYAAMSKESNILTSASGGVFATLAKKILKEDGICFGCSFELENTKLKAKHIKIENENEIYKLQGSKYVQSDMNDIYIEVKKILQEGKRVLFSGTPCQVGALKVFLKNTNTKNLYTTDIICHGTPSVDMFQGYIEILERKIKGKIIEFSFRDKKEGWGEKGKIIYINKKGKKKEKHLHPKISSYYKMFLDSELSRESCYSCKYAGKKRVGDITLGDYWGIEKEHPELLVSKGGTLDTNKGISCVLVNTEKGIELLRKVKDNMILENSTIEKVARNNKQLNGPSRRGENRREILEIYKTKGYKGVNKWFERRLGMKKYAYIVWNLIPVKIRKKIKKYNK